MDKEVSSDEVLIDQYLAGDNEALGILMDRYEMELRGYIDYFSWSDKSTQEDILQDITLVVITSLKNGQFIPQKPGAFKSWLYEVTRHQCYKATEKAETLAKTLPGRTIDAVIPAPEELPEEEDAEKERLELAREILNNVAQILTTEELHLLQLSVVENKTYIEISQLPEFKKYRPAALRQKVCRIRKFFSEEVERCQRIKAK